MTIVNTLVGALPFASVAVISKEKVPAFLGVPVIKPSCESVKPSGSAPELRENVYGPLPLTPRLATYGTSTVPPGSEGVVIVGGGWPRTIVKLACADPPAASVTRI